MLTRTEFGFERPSCGCDGCRMNCKFMPGFLIPADLERLIPEGVEPEVWAAQNLLASPGALVAHPSTGMFRIPTLVPAVKPDGSCIHLTADERCGIHANAPFGCAFFYCGPEPSGLSGKGLMAVLAAWHDGALYARLWTMLDKLGKRQKPAEELRSKMNTELLKRL